MCRYNHINFIPTRYIIEAVTRGIQLHEKHVRTQNYHLNLAKKIKRGKALSVDDIFRLKSCFDLKYRGKTIIRDITDPYYINWLLIGGDTGYKWVASVYNEIEKTDMGISKHINTNIPVEIKGLDWVYA